MKEMELKILRELRGLRGKIMSRKKFQEVKGRLLIKK
jgi:hypothetical protein